MARLCQDPGPPILQGCLPNFVFMITLLLWPFLPVALINTTPYSARRGFPEGLFVVVCFFSFCFVLFCFVLLRSVVLWCIVVWCLMFGFRSFIRLFVCQFVCLLGHLIVFVLLACLLARVFVRLFACLFVFFALLAWLIAFSFIFCLLGSFSRARLRIYEVMCGKSHDMSFCVEFELRQWN